MDFQFSEKSLKLQKELSDFMLEYVNDQEQSILNFQKIIFGLMTLRLKI